VGRLIAGATSANVAAATAFIADVSGKNDRSSRFGLVGATFGAGFVIGPAIGGFLGEYGLRLPFYAAAALAFANALYGIFVLPESLRPGDRRPINWARANPFGLLGRVWRDPKLRSMAFAWSCSWIGLGAVQSSLVLFTRYSFGWGAAANGWVLAGIGLSQAVVEGVLLSSVTGRLGERRTALLGYAAGALGYAVLALALAGWTVVLLALGGLAVPSVRAMVSARGDADTQGEMQGVLTAVEGLTAVVAPLLTAWLFYAFTSPALPVHFAGAPFVLAAGAAVMAAVLLRRL
jgi:DHA1 family tetracycline resistance protein-like MFS transporter